MFTSTMQIQPSDPPKNPIVAASIEFSLTRRRWTNILRTTEKRYYLHCRYAYFVLRFWSWRYISIF